MFKIVVYKNFGPFEFEYETREKAIEELEDKWFSPGVWKIMLYENGVAVDIEELLKSWGERPIYC